jgi:hypothetical protein
MNLTFIKLVKAARYKYQKFKLPRNNHENAAKIE